MRTLFKKILVANRGEVAVRIMNACREMDIPTVALYETADLGSLHMRLADECVPLESPLGYMDQAEVLRIAVERGVDAIHPGYGFLAERPDFIRRCEQAGIAFIGPPAEAMEKIACKVQALERARAAGFTTIAFSARTFDLTDIQGSGWTSNGSGRSSTNHALLEEAGSLGYPVVVKSCSGGRGRGERMVWSPDRLDEAARRVQAEAQRFSLDHRLYLEKAITPHYLVGVQVAADRHGNVVHLGDSQCLVQRDNRKVIEETPAPCLTPGQRERMQRASLDLARLLDFQGVGKVEFLVDGEGLFHFTEIKARLQLEHPLAEMAARVDLVQEQIRIAAGEPLTICQGEVGGRGWTILCRINAESPCQQYLPSSGRLRRVHVPGGSHVRVDTYVDAGSQIPMQYDPLIAKLTVWGENREKCLARTRRVLSEYKLVGIATNLALLREIIEEPEFRDGSYTSQLLLHPCQGDTDCETRLRDLAVAAALIYLRSHQSLSTETAEWQTSGWHQNQRRPPQWNFGGLANGSNGRNHR